MKKIIKKALKKVTAVTFLALVATNANSAVCHGKFVNPVSDICWSCLFPINVGGIELNMGNEKDNGDNAPPLICSCPAPPPVFVRFGVGVSFFEPARMAEVVRTPMCSPTLGGVKFGNFNINAGGNSNSGEGGNSQSFYHVHYFTYPLLSWVGATFTGTACLKNETFDVAYMSELDPLWDDDSLSILLNPEAILFANPISQAACIPDAVKANATGFGFDKLFWCDGSTGTMFPLSGTGSNHTGGVDSSLNILHRFVYKMHREGLGQDTSTDGAMCMALPQPLLRKNQYKQQMVYPIPQTKTGLGFGASSMPWAMGKEFPYKGEDFAYLVWRKQKCCAL